jgi:hypothetical protein
VFPPKANPAARKTMRADQFIREGGKTAFFINISSAGNQVQVLKIPLILWTPRLIEIPSSLRKH